MGFIENLSKTNNIVELINIDDNGQEEEMGWTLNPKEEYDANLEEYPEVNNVVLDLDIIPLRCFLSFVAVL